MHPFTGISEKHGFQGISRVVIRVEVAVLRFIPRG